MTIENAYNHNFSQGPNLFYSFRSCATAGAGLLMVYYASLYVHYFPIFIIGCIAGSLSSVALFSILCYRYVKYKLEHSFLREFLSQAGQDFVDNIKQELSATKFASYIIGYMISSSLKRSAAESQRVSTPSLPKVQKVGLDDTSVEEPVSTSSRSASVQQSTVIPNDEFRKYDVQEPKVEEKPSTYKCCVWSKFPIEDCKCHNSHKFYDIVDSATHRVLYSLRTDPPPIFFDANETTKKCVEEPKKTPVDINAGAEDASKIHRCQTCKLDVCKCPGTFIAIKFDPNIYTTGKYSKHCMNTAKYLPSCSCVRLHDFCQILDNETDKIVKYNVLPDSKVVHIFNPENTTSTIIFRGGGLQSKEYMKICKITKRYVSDCYGNGNGTECFGHARCDVINSNTKNIVARDIPTDQEIVEISL